MSVVLFALSVSLALVLTNLDNLALMVAMLVRLPGRRVMLGFAGAQFVVLVVALVLAEGMELGFPTQAGWLGVVPVFLGLRELIRRGGDESGSRREASTLVAILLTFLSVSADSLSVITPLLADAAPVYRLGGMAGALGAGVILLVSGSFMARGAGENARLVGWLERLAPWVMIGVGTYVLLNTATDMV
ncbi:hypothetical protein [Shimia sp.]|uniref:hypothetical protein n=1 Tax=Shimia sp. TaxID=1954381 RepID=UPI003299A4AE